MYIFVLKYFFDGKSYAAVVKASTLEEAQKIVDEEIFPFEKRFGNVVSKIEDQNKSMAICGFPIPWNS